VAIVAGLVAHALVETLNFGPVAPFDAAGVVMLLGGLVVIFSWTENYGDASNRKGFLEQLQSGARAIANGAGPGMAGNIGLRFRVYDWVPATGRTSWSGCRARRALVIGARPHMAGDMNIRVSRLSLCTA
jgi:hypothetical protein